MIPSGSYEWLNKEPAPRMLLEAIKLFGVTETLGVRDNPVILDWAKEVGVNKVYSHDSIPWCGLFLAVVAKRAGKPVAASPLWALSWARWGDEGGQPELGDVLVFTREGGGHVGIYVGEDVTAYHVLGGNTSDKVTIARIEKHRLYACRQLYTIAKPSNVRPVMLSPLGRLSINEE